MRDSKNGGGGRILMPALLDVEIKAFYYVKFSTGVETVWKTSCYASFHES
jgi:hypothetical protein